MNKEQEIIDFFHSGRFCKEFDHNYKIIAVYNDTDKRVCVYCNKEIWS